MVALIVFPENPPECVDTDNDGVGDNADSDDDDDGWTDADEIRLSSLSSIVSQICSGTWPWDLIGIFAEFRYLLGLHLVSPLEMGIRSNKQHLETSARCSALGMLMLRTRAAQQ